MVELGYLRLSLEEHFEAECSSLSHLSNLKIICDKLTIRQCLLFRQTCFGHFLDISASVKFSGNLVHKMLLHEV